MAHSNYSWYFTNFHYMVNTIFTIIIALIAIWAYLDIRKVNHKFSTMSEERKEKSICEFSRSFNSREIDTWVIRAVYEQIQGYIPSKTKPFPVNANDHLFNDLELDDEDLEMDLIEEIAQRTGRSLEETERNPYFGKIETVKDLVCFINEQPLLKNT